MCVKNAELPSFPVIYLRHSSVKKKGAIRCMDGETEQETLHSRHNPRQDYTTIIYILHIQFVYTSMFTQFLGGQQLGDQVKLWFFQQVCNLESNDECFSSSPNTCAIKDKSSLSSMPIYSNKKRLSMLFLPLICC